MWYIKQEGYKAHMIYNKLIYPGKDYGISNGLWGGETTSDVKGEDGEKGKDKRELQVNGILEDNRLI